MCIRDCIEPNFYYESIQVKVIESGYYTFLSYSRIDTYGYIYKDKFNPLNPLENLLSINDDGGSNLQFRLDVRLVVDMTYVLVVTTSDSRGTGKFSIAALGKNKVTLEHLSEYIFVFYSKEFEQNTKHFFLNSILSFVLSLKNAVSSEHLILRHFSAGYLFGYLAVSISHDLDGVLN